MKIYTKYPCWLMPHVKKFLLVMKITTFLLIVSIVQVSASGFAQKVTFIRKDATLKQLFREITRQTGYSIFYADSKIDHNKKLDASFKDTPLQTLLSQSLKDLPVIYTIHNKNIIIKRNDRGLPDKVPVYFAAIVASGRVLDVEHKPLPGATVKVKDGKGVTVTDGDGRFTLKNIAEGTVLIISYTGYVSKEVKAAVKMGNIVLEQNDLKLDDVVVVGYGTKSRKDLTGSIASVSGKELSLNPVTNVIDALRGKVPGLVVSSSSGSQEAQISVRVRGGISITQDNSPLYIVDGFPTENGFVGINPNDVQSIDVLKDASATAIYGSRGANGVIIITTKRGYEGLGTISYDNYIGVKKMTKRTPVLSPLEFVLYDYERNGGDANWENVYGPIEDVQKNYAGRKGVNWQDLMYDDKTALSSMHRLGFSGGGKDNKYNFSYTYNDDGNIVPNSGYSTHSLRLSLDQKITSKLSLGANISYFADAVRGVGPYKESGKGFNDLIQFRPTAGIQYTDEQLILNDIDPIDDETSVQLNPLAEIENTIRKKKKKNTTYSLSAKYSFSPKLTYNLNLGMNNKELESSNFHTSRSSEAKLSNGPLGSVISDVVNESFGNHTLTYSQTLGEKHQFDVLAGQELRIEKSKSLGISAGGFPDDNFGVDNFNLASIANLPTSGKASSKLFSFFGRANYKFLNRYLFTGTFRADGSTKFGASNKWGYFPSVAVAWRASEEKFIKNMDVFSDLKFRLSYGASGNNRIGNYRSLSIYAAGWTPINNEGFTVFSPSLANSGLKWETNLSTNLGVDIGLFKNRVNATIDLYNIRTKDLLLEARIPLSSGYGTALRNVGSTRSRGLEVGIQSVNMENTNFTWTTNFNISFNKVKVLELANSDRWEIGDFVIEEGGSLGRMWGLQNDGLYTPDDFTWSAATSKWVLNTGVPVSSYYIPEPGVAKYKDISGPDGVPDGISNDLDRTFIGNANPDFTGGLMNMFSYKDFDLSFFWEFKYGGDIYNQNLLQLIRSSKNKSTTKAIYDRRYRTMDMAGNNLLLTGNAQVLNELNANAIYPSQRASVIQFDDSLVENGSYARLTQLTLGYKFSTKLLERLKISRFRIYATVHNPLTITKYSGYDPEVSMNNNNGLTPGIDVGSHPRSASYVLGLNISL